jgi:hypothetical protein
LRPRSIIQWQHSGNWTTLEVWGARPALGGLYGELLWNFKDRSLEPMYVAQLLFRHTRYPDATTRKQEAADSGLRLARLGYEKGAEAVLQAAGVAAFQENRNTRRSSSGLCSTARLLDSKWESRTERVTQHYRWRCN